MGTFARFTDTNLALSEKQQVAFVFKSTRGGIVGMNRCFSDECDNWCSTLNWVELSLSLLVIEGFLPAREA